MNANDVENLSDYVAVMATKVTQAMDLIAEAMAGMIAMTAHLTDQLQAHHDPQHKTGSEVPD